MQKHSIRLLLKKNKVNALGQYPIYICITVDGERSYISTGHYIVKSYWDEKNQMVKPTHQFATDINTDITDRKKEVYDSMHQYTVKKETVSAGKIKERSIAKDDHTNIFTFKDKHIKEVEGKREKGTTDNYSKHLKKLETFHGSKQLSFEQITADYLNDFEAWLRAGNIESRKDDPSHYIHAIMKSIRRMFNAAIKKRLITCYPFGEYEIPEAKAAQKEHLSISELDALEQFAKKTTVPKYKETATWFLFGCYTGLRVSDWYKFDTGKHVFKNYISLQTTKNDGMANIPLHRRLKRLLPYLAATPLKQDEVLINRYIKEIMLELKIHKHITTHCARKTFAVTLCLDRGMTSETAAKLMAITLDVFVESYSRVTPEKVLKETARAWKDL